MDPPPPPPQEPTPAASVPRIYSLSEIEKITNEDPFQTDLIQAIQDGFVEFHRGQFFMAPIQTLGAPPMAPFSVGTAVLLRAQVIEKNDGVKC